MKKTCITLSLMALAMSLAPVAPAQDLGSLNAGMDAMDTLNSGSTGSASSGVGALGIDRARAVVNTANSAPNPFGPAPGADPFAPAGGAPNPFGPGAGFAGGEPAPFGAAPFGEPGANPFGAPAPGAYAGPNPFGGITVPKVATVTAWAGERLVDARSGEILQDAKEIQVLPEFAGGNAGRYFDDGKSFNDAVEGDNIYTNITITRDYISPEAHVVKTKLIQSLQYVSALSPMEFFQIPVVTTEPLSALPKLLDEQEKMDEKIGEWADTFLAEYRVEAHEIGGEFIPTYIPAPPKAPNKPLPSNFTPKEFPAGAQPNAQGAAGFPGAAGGPYGEVGPGVMGGDPQSRYF